MNTTRLSSPAGRRGAELLRFTGTVAAGAAVLMVWLIARYGAKVHPRTPGFGAKQATALPGGFAVAVAVLAGLLGWAVVALLERRARRPRRVWMITGLIVLVLSLSGPLSGHGVTAGERLALICMHLAVAAVLVPVYAHNLAAVRRSRPPVASARAEADETRPG